MEEQDQAPEEEEEDEDARRQLEGLRVVYGACCQFWLTAEAAAGAESTTGLANSLPLSAAMMLDRWSLLLHPDRSSCITPDMIARKAMLLHNASKSPLLRNEVKEELLGRRMLAQEQDAAFEKGEPPPASRFPHMYNIPRPPNALRLFRSPSPLLERPQQPEQEQPPSDAAAAGTAEYLPFSRSHVYTASKAFYARNQERAWISAVPYGVTTNAKLADSYARTILAYLRDLGDIAAPEAGAAAAGAAGGDAVAEAGDAAGWEGPRAVTIVELAAGHGLFGFLLAKRLRELLSTLVPSSWRVRLIMTDFQRALLESRRAAPWLAPFVADGTVDFGVLEGGSAETGPLELLGGCVIRPGSLQGPLIVLSNYGLDSLPSDVFLQFSQGDQEQQQHLSVVRELVADPSTRRFQLADLPPSRLASYPFVGLLRAMLSRGREGLHIVNVGFLTALARLRALLHPANRSVAVLVGDGSMQHDDGNWLNEAAVSLPDMSPAQGSGCFALAVDAQALALAVRWAFRPEDEEEEGEEAWLAVRNTEVEASLTVSLVARRPLPSSTSLLLPRTQEAFWRHLCLESPTDIEQLGGLLQQEVEEDALASFPAPGRRTLLGCLGHTGTLALLAWSNYDADLFFSLLWPLRAHLHALDQQPQQPPQEGQASALRLRTLHAGFRCLTNRCSLSRKAWLYTRLTGMRFFYAVGEPALALGFFLHDAHLVPFSSPLSTTWSHAYGAAWGRAAEAFLVVRCLEALHGQADGADGGGRRFEFPPALRREILEWALADTRLRDGKGKRRIKRALARGPTG